MTRLLTAPLLLTATLAACPPDEPATGEPATAWIERVGGDRKTQTELKVDTYRAGPCAIEAPLPVGYPAPTPPGAIDMKFYPSVRRATVSGTSNPDRRRNGAFWKLFNHIKDRDIAMTSPVEMEYTGLDTDSDPTGWSMAFLYRSTDLGPTGDAEGVLVSDSEPVTVISIGLMGPYGTRTVQRGMDRLTDWLESQNEWEAAGEPRAFFYNGPYVPDRRKWAEVQIPVRRRVTPPTVAMQSGA